MSAKKTGITCRCPICHRADAGSNRQRKSYVVLGIRQDENGLSRKDKIVAHKSRRVREARLWKMEVRAELEESAIDNELEAIFAANYAAMAATQHN